MNCADLYKILEEMTEEERERTEVRITYQPSWPLQAYVSDAINSVDLALENFQKEWAKEPPLPEDEDSMSYEEAMNEVEVNAQQEPVLFIVGQGGVYETPYAPAGIYN